MLITETEQHVQAPLARGRWLVAGVLLVIVVSGFFDRISIALLFNNTDFQTAMGIGFDPARLGLLMTSFLFAYGVSSIVLSFVGDRFGPRRSLLVSAALWGGLMGWMGAAGSYASMIGARIALGVAEGPQFSLLNKVVGRWFPPGERARANATWLVGSPLGSAIGFPLTIALVAAYGWRVAFYVFGAVNLLVVLPLIFAIVRDRPAGAPAHPAGPRRSIVADLRVLLAMPHFWLFVVFNCGVLIYLWGINTWLPSYLQRVRHFDTHELGLFSALPFLMVFLGQVGSAWLSDKFGRRATTCFVGLFSAGVFMLLTAMVPNAYLAALLLAVSGGCWGASIPSAYALAQDMIPANIGATGVGVFNGIGNLAGACAPYGMGLCIEYFGTIDAGLYVMVAATMIGSLAMLPLLRRY